MASLQLMGPITPRAKARCKPGLGSWGVWPRRGGSGLVRGGRGLLRPQECGEIPPAEIPARSGARAPASIGGLPCHGTPSIGMPTDSVIDRPDSLSQPEKRDSWSRSASFSPRWDIFPLGTRRGALVHLRKVPYPSFPVPGEGYGTRGGVMIWHQLGYIRSSLRCGLCCPCRRRRRFPRGFASTSWSRTGKEAGCPECCVRDGPRCPQPSRRSWAYWLVRCRSGSGRRTGGRPRKGPSPAPARYDAGSAWATGATF
jgi:hypothetical protein